MSVSKSMVEAVWKRAGNRCEYCHLPATADMESFHLEHIRARQHGGASALHNLALSCPRCNSCKGPNLAGIDPQSKRQVALFDPRKKPWTEHFRRIGPEIIGLTATGRATVATLAMNSQKRQLLRAWLIETAQIPRDE